MPETSRRSDGPDSTHQEVALAQRKCIKRCFFPGAVNIVVFSKEFLVSFPYFQKKTARDPKQCGGSKRIVYYNVDEYDDDDDEDGDDDDNDDDDVH